MYGDSMRIDIIFSYNMPRLDFKLESQPNQILGFLKFYFQDCIIQVLELNLHFPLSSQPKLIPIQP